MNWKQLTKNLIDIHVQNKSAVVSLDPHSVGVLVNLSDDDFCLTVEGKEIKPKKVRRFLWEQRKKRALNRSNAAIWSAYMEKEDKTYVGVGAITSQKVADRIQKLRGE